MSLPIYKSYVYVDGFNFYYGCTRGTKLKWANLEALMYYLIPNQDIQRLKLFAARSKGYFDPNQPIRQEKYFRALRTLPTFELIDDAQFRRRKFKGSRTDTGEIVEVWRIEEKGSDVNLATHLVRDAFVEHFDMAVVVSNDVDLKEAVRIVTQETNKRVALVKPRRQYTELEDLAFLIKNITKTALRACQFPHVMQDEQGQITIPKEWK
jgi:uncharacterized LabA/DUF88 family protein